MKKSPCSSHLDILTNFINVLVNMLMITILLLMMKVGDQRAYFEPCSKTSCTVSHLILRTSVGGRSICYPHFTDEA